MSVGRQDVLTIHHFNDVVSITAADTCHLSSKSAQYHISDPDLIARFAQLFDPSGILPTGSKPLRLFSGDAFSPSLEASVMRGEHMTPVLNHLQIDVACYGNHGLHCVICA